MKREGIPTEYKWLRFRSRLEATWARFFDLVGWKWKYEPFDYDGYIPDFALLFPAGNILAEVKPCLTLEEMRQHTEKIDASPWKHEALILGVGLLGESDSYGYPRHLGLHRHYDIHPTEGYWEPAVILKCQDHVTFRSSDGGWWCRYGGKDHQEFVGYEGERNSWFDEKWALAQNLVQWAPKMFGVESANV